MVRIPLVMVDDAMAEKAVATGARIGSLATANLPALAAYGITQADLTKLSTLSATFGNIKTAPRTAVVNRKKQTEMLPPVFSQLSW